MIFTASSFADPDALLVGASGGVYSLIFSHLANVILNWAEMRHAVIRLTVILIFAAADTGNAIYYRYIVKDGPRISYAAHFAGAIVGVLVGVLVLRNLKLLKWESIIWWVVFVTLIGLFIAMVIASAAIPSTLDQMATSVSPPPLATSVSPPT